MSKKKYCYEYTEYRQYKCCLCGRTMHKPTPHICNGQYIKHKLIFMKKDKEKGTTKEECNMTKEEIKKFLDNTKVYVNGKSEEIQEKLFSFGYTWYGGDTKVGNIEAPFLFIYTNMYFNRGSSMVSFCNHENREISAEEILSLELTEPAYRPFKDKEECWNEMLKHQPFGWTKRINGGYKQIMSIHIDIFNKQCAGFAGQTGTACFEFEYIYKNYTFADGTPFGIKE